MKDETSVGVVVGRFQIPDLHIGHEEVISHALANHRNVLVLIGNARKTTEVNALTFDMRRDMVRAQFGFAVDRLTIMPLNQSRDDYEIRSTHIDEIVQRVFPAMPAIIYGGRDSIIHKYTGRFPTKEVQCNFDGSATRIRESIVPINSSDFRAGIIYAASNRKPIVYPAVDIAIVYQARQCILLVQKPDERLWRFPGGMVEPTDASLEDAARREGAEEVPGVTFQLLGPIGSRIVDDWRYQRSKDRIMTTLMLAKFLDGEAIAGSDVARAQWFEIHEMVPHMVPEHLPLATMLYLAVLKM